MCWRSSGGFASLKSTVAALIATTSSLLLCASLPAAVPVYLVEGGRPLCVVVLPDDATPGEQYAAQEFREHLREISGAEIPEVVENAYALSMGPAVDIGRTVRSREY